MYHKSNKLSRPDCPPESNARFPFLDLEFFWTYARRECISTGKERKVPRNKIILLKTLLLLFLLKKILVKRCPLFALNCKILGGIPLILAIFGVFFIS